MRPVLLVLAAGLCFAADPAPAPRFTDPERRAKLARGFADADKVFEGYFTRRALPGLVYGIVIDGAIAHMKTFGVRERTGNTPVTPETAFRIASMTKSFTALAVLKLRDEGKLSLEDPVSKWIPEIGPWRYPTADTAPLRVRQLLTHGSGFPEDNPWGDRQLGIPDRTLAAWLKAEVPFSTPPDTQFEYSNYGFALAGRVVQQASGMSYRDYVEKRILAPLGLASSSLEPEALPAAARAVGYGKTGDEYFVIPSLPHGSFGAMGGMVTTARDLGRYVALHLDAWPPRDDRETGPVRRASLREMQSLQRRSTFNVRRGVENAVAATFGGYGFGLSVSEDCRFAHIVGHGGGLPGFGSYMMWLPEYGVGMFAMANLTYAGPAAPMSGAFDALRQTGGLEKRKLPVAPVLAETQTALARLYEKWDDAALRKLAADNLFLDRSLEQRRKEVEALHKQLGPCQPGGELAPENWLRGAFTMKCEKGSLHVSFTLAPTQPPLIQYLNFWPGTAPFGPRERCPQ